MKKKVGKFSAVWSILAAACMSVSLYLEMFGIFWVSAAALVVGIVTLIVCLGKTCKKVIWNVIDVLLS